LRPAAAVVTVSDGVAAGEREDASGELLVQLLEAEGYAVEHRVVPDDRPRIAAALRELSREARLILTTGGTGVSPRDFTPEATESVLDRRVPGIAEALRADAIRQTPHGLLGRGTAGIRGNTLIVNLPGSPGGCRDGFHVIRPALEHGLGLLAGEATAHRPT
jgi:molybdopterin adenylyltransferase